MRLLAAGLTPAWQQVVVLDALRPGEVNRARETHWCASGKVFNVAIAAARLGAQTRMVSLLGGPLSSRVESELAEEGIDRHWVRTESLRTCTSIVERGGGTTELVEEAAPVLPEQLEAFRQTYRAISSNVDIVVLTGSLPRGTPEGFYRDLIAETKAPVVLDARGNELLAALESKPWLVKPNREELGITLGRPITTDAELLSAMRSLNDRGAKWVVITQGSKPVWVSSNDEVYTFEPPTVEVLNPIGCGDCLTAGIAIGHVTGKSLVEAVRYGIAVAATSAGTILPGRFETAGVDELVERVQVAQQSDA